MLLRLGCVGVLLTVSLSAFADCRPNFRFNAGKDGRGLVQNIAPGEACRIQIYRTSGGSNGAQLQSVQVIKPPGQGVVSYDSTTVIYKANSNFNGFDRMMVRYNYVASDGRAIKSDVAFRLRH